MTMIHVVFLLLPPTSTAAVDGVFLERDNPYILHQRYVARFQYPFLPPDALLPRLSLSLFAAKWFSRMQY